MCCVLAARCVMRKVREYFMHRLKRGPLQIERDEWVAALNNAIEKLASSEQDREERIKAFPWLKHRD